MSGVGSLYALNLMTYEAQAIIIANAETQERDLLGIQITMSVSLSA